MVTGCGREHGHPGVKTGLLGVRKPEISADAVMDGALTVSLPAHSECLSSPRWRQAWLSYLCSQMPNATKD